MTDFLSKYKQNQNSQTEKSAEEILNELSQQLNKEFINDGIFSLVISSGTYGEGHKVINLTLSSPTTKNEYFYRLIEIKQPIDKYYNIEIRAFQTATTDWITIKDSKELEVQLTEFLGDPRFMIVISMIKQNIDLMKSFEAETDE